MKELNLNSNLWSGLFLLIFSLVLILMTPGQVPLYEGSDAMSPRLVPYTVLSLLAIMGLYLVIKEFFRIRRLKRIEDKAIEVKGNEVVLAKRSYRDLSIFIGMSLFLVLTAEYIGFTFAAIIILMIALRIFHVKKWYMILLIGIGMPILIDMLFRFLEIYLPLGFWEGIIY